MARDLTALAITSVACFTLLSIISLNLGRQANLGGPIGAELAFALSNTLGLAAYPFTLILLVPAFSLWRGEHGVVVVRHFAGALVLLAALIALIALASNFSARWSGWFGLGLASSLTRYLSFGGGYLVISFVALCAMALVCDLAPSEIVHAILRRLRRRHAEEEVIDDLAALDLSFGDDPDLVLEGLSRAPGRRIEVRSTAPEPPARSKQSAHSRSKGGFKLPPHSLLDSPPLEHAQVDEASLERSARLLEQKLAAFGIDGRVVEVQPGPVVTMYKFEPASGIKVSQIVNLADDLSMALKALAVRIQAPVPGEAVVGIEVPNRKRERVFLREILEAEEFQTTQSLLTIALGKDISGQPQAADLARMPHLLIAGATGTGKSVSIHTMIAAILFNATADDVRFILIDPKMLELSVYEDIPHLLVPVVVDPDKAAAALLWATQEMENRYRMMRDLGVRNIDGYNQALSNRGKVVELKRRTEAPIEEKSHSHSDALINRIGSAHGEAEKVCEEAIEHRKLPKIVIVIDELADLLLHEGKTVERDITRLAQKARAAGIHLILATQRPSVDILTGLIKANLPARISFQVTSRVDSRTILDSIGAERLLGSGDMLFMPPGTAKLRRLHGPFVSEDEIRKVADFLRAQGSPDYDLAILETKPPGVGDDDDNFDDFRDELYDEAVRIVIETNQASISAIQRRLRIGYNRAARMVERMEREGLVEPADGAKPRAVRSAR
jgi:S-DNA-T family DNA segregation ATPase FtsK/SpoIIIE